MKRIYHIVLIVTICVLAGIPQLHAQENKQNANEAYSDYSIYTYAEQLYNNGYFDHAIELVGNLKKSSDAAMRSSAYRLIALCHIEQGNLNEAKLDVQNLLTNDPYFSPSASDNPILADLLRNSKHHGGATITTASQQAESIEEAPVPVILITEDMLHDIGARTLKDALLAYVPGMTDVSNNEEMTIAMRGIYSGHQDKILILLDGHRMNSYTTNRATPDYSISLEKIKQIEVLRGPASSIYGGVALTAVINLITKKGVDIDGIKVKGSAGNYGQMKADVLIGKRLFNIDFMIWGSIFNSNGEKVYLNGGLENQPYSFIAMMGIDQPGNIYIDRFAGNPTYDLGMTLQYKGLELMYTTTYTNHAPTYTMSTMFSPYDYYKYGKINGNRPGLSNSSNRLNIRYSKSIGKFDLSASGGFDYINSLNYMVVGDTIPDLGEYGVIIPNGTNVELNASNGAFQSIAYTELSLSGKLMLGYNYAFGKNKGNLLFGAETTYFNLSSSAYQEGDEFNRILKVYNHDKILSTGTENMFDVFAQLKHTWNECLILNTGLRFDHKKNINQIELVGEKSNKTINVASPRVALIWNKPKYFIKASYAAAFVDAPYYYRNNCLDTEFGILLEPEYLKSLQLSFASNEHIKNIKAELNFVYNSLDNYIFTSQGGEYLINGGRFKNFVTEMTLWYLLPKFKLYANFTYQHMLKSENYASIDNKTLNIPAFQSNITGSYTILPGLNIHASLNATSKQHVICGLEDEQNTLPARAIIGAGADYRIKQFEFQLNVHNLLNTEYSLGGIGTSPIRQQGRWILGSVAYKF